MKRWMYVITVIMVWSAAVFSAIFYVDPLTGSDQTGTGTQHHPWQSLEKTFILTGSAGAAKTAGDAGTTVILKKGHYGFFALADVSGLAKTAGSGWTVYKAAPGEEVVFDGMQLVFTVQTPLYMRFEGIKILYPGSGVRAKAAQAAGGPVDLRNVSNVEYVDATIWGGGRDSGNGMPAVYVDNCSQLLFHHCDIGKQETGMGFGGCQDVSITYNHIHEGTSSGIKYAGGNRDFLIEGNHIHDYPYNPVTQLHGSVISIRSGDVVIRGNLMHDGFSSSGMMTYLDTDIAYSNITIENNLMYDIGNTPMRIYHLGTNVVFKNNTFVGSHDPNSTGYPDPRYYLGGAFAVESVQPGYDGSGLSVYNNIFIGIYCCGGRSGFIRTGNNIIWSYNHQAYDFTCTPPEPNSHVVTCSYFDDAQDRLPYFTNGFFAQVPDLTSSHGKTLDFHLAAGSPAVNAGDAAHQPTKGLGTLDEDGFLQDNGVVRDAAHHSVGCYEYSTTAVSRLAYPVLPSPDCEALAAGKERVYALDGRWVRKNAYLADGIYLIEKNGALRKAILVKN